jgi:hypothetical protein
MRVAPHWGPQAETCPARLRKSQDRFSLLGGRMMGNLSHCFYDISRALAVPDDRA